MSGRRILVCGGRDYTNAAAVHRQLEALNPAVVIHGGARGADNLADAWARQNNITVEVYPADWKQLGRKAGVLRNQQMLDEGHPDIVVAFPGGRGTDDMVERARRAKVELRRVLYSVEDEATP